MIFTAFTPTKWKEAKVIFIPKPGKSSRQIAKNFRPTKHQLKGLKKLVVQNEDQALENMPISKHQQGFQRFCILYSVFQEVTHVHSTEPRGKGPFK